MGEALQQIRAHSAHSSADERADVEGLISDFVASELGDVSMNVKLVDTSRAVQFGLNRLARAAARDREFVAETAGLVVELRQAGFEFDRLGEFDSDAVGTPAAVPIFMKWLARAESPSVRMTLLSLLHNRWAKPDAVEPLLAELRRVRGTPLAEEHGGCWDIVLALVNLVDTEDFQIFVDIATDPANGSGRRLAILNLKRMRKHRDELTPLMLEFLASDDFVLYRPASECLAAWHVEAALPRIEELLATVNTRPAPAFAKDIGLFRRTEKSDLMAALRKLRKPRA